MDYKEQLALWRQGRSLHNDELNQCCPDFSCCDPSLQSTQGIRDLYFKAFTEGNEKLIQDMLVGFMQRACNKLTEDDPEYEVHVVDRTNHTIPS